ncbi:MAG: YfhO family protein, partial [Acidobacteria bacterium]|nr:YfhO family protein [Acidobacteriota bacterium]
MGWLWPIAAVLAPLIPMRGMFSSEKVYCFRDMGQEFWPMTQWFKLSTAAGEYPLWDPFLGYGQSAVADPVRSLLFPPVVLVRMLFPEALALNLAVGLAIPLAALGAYLLIRRTLSAPSAAVGAVAFAMAGPVLSTGNMLNFVWSVALMPWVIWAVLHVADRWSGPRFVAASACIALQLLAGEPATNAATLCLALLLAVAVEPGGFRDLALRGARGLGAMLAGLALAAVQYLPLLNAVVQSERGSRAANLSFWSVHPLRLVEAVAILPFGDPLMPPATEPWVAYLNSGREPFLLSLYLGAAVVVLALLGCATGPRRRAVVWAVAGAMALLFSLGDHIPVYPTVVGLLPVLRIFRYPEKYFVVVALCTALLSAEGAEALIRGQANAIRTAAIAGGLLTLATVGLAFVAHDEPRQAIMLSAAGVAIAAAIVAGIAAVARRPGLAAWAPVALLCVVGAELAFAGFGLNPQAHTASLIRPLWVASATVRDDRVYVGGRAGCPPPTGGQGQDVDTIAPQAAFPKSVPVSALPALVSAKTAQFPSRWGLREAISVDNQILFPREYKDAVRAFCERNGADRCRFLERTGVRVHLLNKPPAGYFDTRTPVEMLAPVVAYSSSVDSPRCAVISGSRVEPDTATAVAALFREDFDPASEVLVGSESVPAGTRSEAAESSARIVRDRSNEVTVEVSATSDSVLVLYDSYDPDWRVEVDGQTAEMVRANGLFRGVRIVAGQHTVRFAYRPRSLIVGAIITGISLVCLVGLMALAWRRHERGPLRKR